MSPADVVERIDSKFDGDWVLTGRCPGGEVGAFFVEKGAESFVMKWTERSDAETGLSLTIARLQQLADRGYPIPQYLPPLDVDGATVVIQSRIFEGETLDYVSQNLMSELINYNKLQHDLSPKSNEWCEFMRSTLVEGADGWCLHEPLRSHSAETSEILDWIRSVGQHLESLPCGDLVHMDFHHRNLLQANGRLIAVYDWEGSKAGDRAFDLVTFAFNLIAADRDPAVDAAVWSAINKICEPHTLQAYVAHMCLRRLDWQIRHHPETVPLWLARAQECREMVA